MENANEGRQIDLMDSLMLEHFNSVLVMTFANHLNWFNHIYIGRIDDDDAITISNKLSIMATLLLSLCVCLYVFSNSLLW